MTLETMSIVVDQLKQRGIPATFEYPGFIQVPSIHNTWVMYGDLGDTFEGQHMDADRSELIEVFESSIPCDSTDILGIVDFIACNYSEGALMEESEIEQARRTR